MEDKVTADKDENMMGGFGWGDGWVIRVLLRGTSRRSGEGN